MSRQAAGGAQGGQQADAEVAATVTAITRLRRRLWRLGTAEHPVVRRELQKLEEQLVALSDQSERRPGRHRFPASTAPGNGDALEQKTA